MYVDDVYVGGPHDVLLARGLYISFPGAPVTNFTTQLEFGLFHVKISAVNVFAHP